MLREGSGQLSHRGNARKAAHKRNKQNNAPRRSTQAIIHLETPINQLSGPQKHKSTEKPQVFNPLLRALITTLTIYLKKVANLRNFFTILKFFSERGFSFCSEE
jgi:hypothetical protein